MDMRVEQLSVRSGVPVDTIRYYQSKGLLEPPRREGRLAWYGPDHLDRLERIRSLQQRGFTLATIVRLVDGELDAADEALIDELTGTPPPASRGEQAGPGTVAGGKASASPAASPAPGPAASPAPGPAPGPGAGPAGDQVTFTLAELAVETGVPLALLKALEAEGLLIPRRMAGQECYTSEDVDSSRAGLLLLEWGIPLSALLDVSRRHHQATEAVAREAVALFAEHIRGPLREGGDPRGAPVAPADSSGRARPSGAAGPSGAADATEREISTLLLAYEQLLPAVTTLVGHHFARALVKAALDHVEQIGSDEERRAIWMQAGLHGSGHRTDAGDTGEAGPQSGPVHAGAPGAPSTPGMHR
jgi:DNA-binding transcriptional MerR regulator